MSNYISDVVNEMDRWFEDFNKKFFNSELECPIFTIQKSRSNVNGHCTVDKLWADKDVEKCYREVNISAHSLHRPVVDIAATVLHELIHVYHLSNEIKDCSGKIHNKKFKAKAEEFGFIVEKAKNCGWGITKAGDDLAKWIADEIKPNEDVFVYARQTIQKDDGEKKTREKKIFTYVCPECDEKAKAKKDVKLICGKCEVEMEMEEE